MYRRHMVDQIPPELFNLNFRSLKVVSRYRDPQHRMNEHLCEILVPTYISVSRLKAYFTFNNLLCKWY